MGKESTITWQDGGEGNGKIIVNKTKQQLVKFNKIKIIYYIITILGRGVLNWFSGYNVPALPS